MLFYSKLNKLNFRPIVRNIGAYFCVLFLFFSIVRLMNFYRFLPSSINITVFGLLALCGLCGAAINFVFNFKCQNKFLIFFWLSILVSCVLRMRYGFIENLKELIWYAIDFFLLYQIRDNKHLLDVIKKITTMSFLVITFLSLVTYVIQLNFYVEIEPNDPLLHEDDFRFGFIENRLFGLFSNPNSASTATFISILFLFEELTKSKIFSCKFWQNIIFIFIQFTYIILAGSRTVFLAMILNIFIASWGYIRSLKEISKSKRPLIISMLLSFLCCVFFCFFCTFFKKILSFLPCLFNANIKKINTERIDIKTSGDISNLRFSIWLSAIEIFKKAWLFGTSPKNLIMYANDVIPNTFMVRLKYRMVHNTYIEIFVYTGIIGACCFYPFIIKNGSKLLKILSEFISRIKNVNIQTRTAMFAVFSIAIFGFFEPGIIFSSNILTFFLWLFV
ncbi:MAG: O-antigen ligase family protein [Candidatus Improbicoccus pseudotrichonymphae]|uniref:O-antigen ligase family protein n=1 Tax=Candidatus Improbicoccus pseudotrichonymphae TaxID=3033792 RepID=A0AA48L0P3_9FIRM|nr:MAG: O-antigen ligase family protein [Candidatus Improbicoccus pseudotrichonymphae]